MKIPVFFILTALFLSCGGGGEVRSGGAESSCTAVTPMENLAPYIGRCIELKGVVTETGYPSISDYWIPVPELEKYRGQRIKLKGTLETRKERSSGGSDQGSERGVYFIKVISVEPLNK